MSVLQHSACDLGADEWDTWGPDCSRDAAIKRTGAASVMSTVTGASSDGRFYGWGGTRGSPVAALATSYAAQNRAIAALYATGLPTGAPVYGPIFNLMGAIEGRPYCTGLIQASGFVGIYDAAWNLLADSNPNTLPTASWEVMMVEFDHPAETVRVWVWNAGTPGWDLYITYDHGAQIAVSDYTRIMWGWQNPKEGAINMNAYTDDIFWCDSAGNYATARPTTPAECYSGIPDGDGTYDAWTENGDADGDKFDEVDDLSGGGAHDSDITYNNSATGTAAIKQTYTFPAAIAPGNRTIQGVGVASILKKNAGTNGTVSHLLRGDATDGEGILAIPAAYDGRSAQWERTPSNKVWTPALVNGIEYGLVRGAGASAMNDIRQTAAFINVVECEVAAATPRRRMGSGII